ncbi:MAG: hypothetical protein AAFY31_01910 [Pseudomonadota bacterium]
MFRMFSFLPPFASYILAIGVMAGTYYLQAGMLEANPEADVNKVWLVGGIIAFLLGFSGFQKSIEHRSEKMQPRVSSADVLQKLTPTETGVADQSLEVVPQNMQALDEDSPLARIRARSNPVETL